MAQFTPAYRMTLYVPRSVDAAESAPLTPIDTAVHQDAFQVTSVQGLIGWKPYLDMPKGRKGRVDLLERKTDKGTLQLRLLDKRVAPPDNLKRWVTAFLGDSAGVDQLLGCKVLVEESLDYNETTGLGTWTPFFTGRVQRAGMSEPLYVDLTITDMAEELDMDIFVARPAASVSYAFTSSLLPQGLTGSYASFPKVVKNRGKMLTENAVRYLSATDTGLRPANVICQALAAYADTATTQNLANMVGWSALDFSGDKVRAWIKRLDTGASGEVLLTKMIALFGDNTSRVFQCSRIGISALSATDPNYIALPPDGVQCDWFLFPTGGPTSAAPIFINDVHVVQFIKDLLSGNFHYLNSDGTPTRSVKFNTANFDALLADTTFQKVRMIIDAKATLNDFLEKFICKSFGLAYYFNGAGEFTLVDLRSTSTLPDVATITDTDLVEDPNAVDWGQARDSAVTRVDVTYYKDDYVAPSYDQYHGENGRFPDVNPTSVAITKVPFFLLDEGPRAQDLGEYKQEIDAKGIRTAGNNLQWEQLHTVGTSSYTAVEQRLLQMIREFRTPFATGLQEVTLKARRNSAADCQIGDRRYIDISTIPNPTSNQRGGIHLMICTGRVEDGLVLNMDFSDLGQAINATVPAISAAANGVDAQHQIDVTVTINGQAEPAIIEMAAVDLGGARPAETSGLWVQVGTALVTGTQTIAHLHAGRRCWFRARTMPGLVGHQTQPSAWVYASGTGYVETTPLPTPTNIQVSNITDSTASLSWTPASALYETDVFLTTGNGTGWVPGEADRIDTKAAGDSFAFLVGLDGPNAEHTVAIRHRDSEGSLSALVTFTFSTSDLAAIAPKPVGLSVIPG